MADRPAMNVTDKNVLTVFTTKQLTVMLLGVAYTYRQWAEGKFDSEAIDEIPKDRQEAMMAELGEMRPRLVELIFQAIGKENAETVTAYMEQKLMEMQGAKPN